MTPNPKIQELIKSIGIIPEDEHYDIAQSILAECIDIAEQTRYEGKVVAARIKFVFGLK